MWVQLVGVILILLIKARRPGPLWAALFPAQGTLDYSRGSKLSTKHECVYSLCSWLWIDSCLMLLPLCLPRAEPYITKNCQLKENPYSSRSLSVRVFYHINRNESYRSTFTYKTSQFPAEKLTWPSWNCLPGLVSSGW